MHANNSEANRRQLAGSDVGVSEVLGTCQK